MNYEKEPCNHFFIVALNNLFMPEGKDHGYGVGIMRRQMIRL